MYDGNNQRGEEQIIKVAHVDHGMSLMSLGHLGQGRHFQVKKPSTEKSEDK